MNTSENRTKTLDRRHFMITLDFTLARCLFISGLFFFLLFNLPGLCYLLSVLLNVNTFSKAFD